MDRGYLCRHGQCGKGKNSMTESHVYDKSERKM